MKLLVHVLHGSYYNRAHRVIFGRTSRNRHGPTAGTVASTHAARSRGRVSGRADRARLGRLVAPISTAERGRRWPSCCRAGNCRFCGRCHRPICRRRSKCSELVAKFEQPAKGARSAAGTKSKGTGPRSEAVPQAASRFLELEPTATGDGGFRSNAWCGRRTAKAGHRAGEQLWWRIAQSGLATIAADDGWQGRDLLTAEWLHAGRR